MSDERDDAPELDPCACCDGLSADTPVTIDNLPALPAVRYRTGTYATFKSSMLARLVTAELAPDPFFGPVENPAPPPDVYAGDEFSAALIDAFAVTADVLTFYQERIANESYLRTATERRSVLELARMIGYELKPGVAASVPLKMVLEEPLQLPSSPAASTTPPMPPPLREAPIPTGTKVQSVPKPGETPQTFETIEDIIARPEWNDIRPRMFQAASKTATTLFVSGNIDVKAGDTIVVEGKPYAVKSAKVLDDIERTRVVLQVETAEPIDDVITKNAAQAIQIQLAITRQALLTGTYELDNPAVQNCLITGKWDATDLLLIASLQGWSIDDLERTIRERAEEKRRVTVAVQTFAVRAGIFGHNAPSQVSVKVGNDYVATDVPNNELDADSGTTAAIDLDNVYQGIAADTPIVLMRTKLAEETQPLRKVYTIKQIDALSRVSIAQSARVTRLHLDRSTDLDEFHVRDTTVFAQSTSFDAGDRPVTTVISGLGPIPLDGVFTRLAAGAKIAISGSRADAPELTVSEVPALAAVEIDGQYTYVTFGEALTYAYVRDTVTFSANVADATHGESVEELLGDGDASVSYQQFTLRQPPLTYVSDPAVSGGARSTLEIWVDEVRWTEVASLYGQGPRARVYVTRRTDDGVTRVQFGDGITGARLPTGQANVRAKYRKGIGLGGIVDAQAITLLVSRPLGLMGASNPLPSSGADDPEVLDAARTNAPLTVLTLDRVVSLSDYGDYARGYAGVAKALGTWMRGRERRGVFVTVAGPDGRAITDTAAIETALHTFGDPHVPVRVRSFTLVYFRIYGTVTVNADRDAALVQGDVETVLRTAFSFDERDFGQTVHLSEVVAFIQNVAGVASVTVTKLERSDGAATLPLRANVPFGEITTVEKGAELLLLDRRPLDLVVSR
ncbi:MAG: hypothetical protein M3P06_01345 [Acidobacteriota bacterium]|nr:hypothetical protein [Acidobacteriota bacterium]